MSTKPAEGAEKGAPLPTPLDSAVSVAPADAGTYDERILRSSTPHEAILWTQIRGELMRQDDEAADRAHRRALERVSHIGKVALSAGAVGVGSVIVFFGSDAVGFFVLGAGLFWLAPDFVMEFLKKLPDRNVRDE